MQFRKFGKLNFEVSALGFGCMRFSSKINEAGIKVIDFDQSIKMLKYAIDKGLNYIDTAYIYHEGKSESILGEVIKDGYRSKVRIATKLPIWDVEKIDDFDRYLDIQLKRLQTDYIDCYLFHALNKELWENKVLRMNLLKRAELAKRAGKIKFLGFSFHDEYDVFTSIIDEYNKWDFCQIQYNYIDINNQAGVRGLKYAAKKGLGVVIMEPLLGGILSNPPKAVQAVFKTVDVNRTPTDWALQWLWNQPEISVVLSGMGNMQQIIENIDSADNSGIGKMTSQEINIIERARNLHEELTLIPCVSCNYCLPCPQGINIPYIFDLFTKRFNYDRVGENRNKYGDTINRYINEIASSCNSCKTCENRCPQNIKVSSWMRMLKYCDKLPHNIKYFKNLKFT